MAYYNMYNATGLLAALMFVQAVDRMALVQVAPAALVADPQQSVQGEHIRASAALVVVPTAAELAGEYSSG